jgi:hypothetical protein
MSKALTIGNLLRSPLVGSLLVETIVEPVENADP